MGGFQKAMMGGVGKSRQVGLMTPEQQNYLQSVIGGDTGQQAGQAYRQFLQPQGVGDYQDIFQQTYIDPAMQTYQQQVLPGIQQRFVDADAGSSSALNQALAQSAQDLSTSLGSQFGQFYQQQQANQLAALGQLGGFAGQQTFQPYVQQRQGLLGPLIGAAGKAAGAYFGGGI